MMKIQICMENTGRAFMMFVRSWGGGGGGGGDTIILFIAFLSSQQHVCTCIYVDEFHLDGGNFDTATHSSMFENIRLLTCGGLD